MIKKVNKTIVPNKQLIIDLMYVVQTFDNGTVSLKINKKYEKKIGFNSNKCRLDYTWDRTVCPWWPLYEVKCLCYRGQE